MELTKSELQIMDVLWEAGKPLSRADLLQQSAEKTWKDSSVHILLNGLLHKGAIQEAGFVKCSKTYGRTFVPSLTREAYYATTIFCHTYKPKLVTLVSELLSRRDITPEQLNEIERLVAERKSEL